jgi:hypothetical protein
MSFTTMATAPVPPATPVLASPANGVTNQSVSPTLTWNASSGATSYHLQVSSSSTFSPLVYDNASLTGTSQGVSGLANSTLYYWRVCASNSGGTSAYSAAWGLTTSPATLVPPPAPGLASPLNGSTGISTNPPLSWYSSTGATAYEVQVASDAQFTAIVWDHANVGTTSDNVTGLAKGVSYFWRVKASNGAGTSSWSAANNFTTTKGGGRKTAEIITDPNASLGESPAGSLSVPQSFELQQNYPNPFNPTTTISFSVPQASTVTLTVYNLVGQEITRLVAGTVEAGLHSVVWDAKDISQNLVPSGVYLYRIQATSLESGKEEFTQVRKMTFLK